MLNKHCDHQIERVQRFDLNDGAKTCSERESSPVSTPHYCL